MQVGKVLLSILLAVVLLVVLYLNYGLYYQPRFVTENGNAYNADVLGQPNFLDMEMHQGAAEGMQHIYPEGFVFMNALYALSWAEVAKPLNHHSDLYHRAHNEIEWAYAHINGDRGRANFLASLKIPYGAFYTGWSSYVLGKKLEVEKPEERDTAQVQFFELQCKQIAVYINKEQNPFAESYSEAAWPADMTLCLASLSLHDKILQPEFASTITKWTDEVKQHLDANGLIPHASDAVTGGPLQAARGSSQSLILHFLRDIDRPFAQQQFEIYHRLFVTHRLGLPGIREYAEGTRGYGDSDSGPVIWGVGGSASIVGLRTMALYKDSVTAVGLRNSIQTFGMVTHDGEQKKFLFGALPMADAFIVWANSTETSTANSLQAGYTWRIGFQFLSLGILLLLTLSLSLIWKPRGKH